MSGRSFACTRDPPRRRVQRRSARGADVYGVLLAAGAADAALARLHRKREEGRRERSALIVRALAGAGRLRPGLDEREATDIMFALSGPEVFSLLVSKSGWSASQYENWLVSVLEGLLMDETTHR